MHLQLNICVERIINRFLCVCVQWIMENDSWNFTYFPTCDPWYLRIKIVVRVEVTQYYVIIFDALMQIAVTLWIGQHFSAQRTPGRSGFEQYCKKDAIQFITAWKENVAYLWYMVGFLFVGNAPRGPDYFQASINMQEVIKELVYIV